jgi:alkylation response protein AidB-like acyl-CoA dehydrogenase
MWKGKFPECKARFMAFYEKNIVPNEGTYFDQVQKNRAAGNPWQRVPIIAELTEKAKAENLWNLFLTPVSGLTQREYAELAEVMGRTWYCSQIFNCDAPDTGNMETLHLFGNAAQKSEWLEPMLQGRIKSAIGITEPDVASSDPTNLITRGVVVGDKFRINGRKWWTSGAGHPDCAILLALVRTADDGPIHQRHTLVLVPMASQGVKVVRHLTKFGYDDAPHGHMEVELKDVEVPVANVILGVGRGFEVIQGRLGPGRIHHCMRSIGMAERALELLIARAASRKTYGKRVLEYHTVQNDSAQFRIDIDQARLLVLHAAHLIDTIGAKKAQTEIAMIKVVAPNVTCRVADKAMQVWGGKGVSDDVVLAAIYVGARTLRIADGPDEVHMRQIARREIRKQQSKLAKL